MLKYQKLRLRKLLHHSRIKSTALLYVHPRPHTHYSYTPSQDLDSPSRSLVKDGQVYLKNIKKLYQCILFNDLLVFAHGDSKQSKVELQLNLEAVWVEDLEDLDPQTSERGVAYSIVGVAYSSTTCRKLFH